MHVPTTYEIETYTGRYVDTAHPGASQIDIRDIAHSLAATCRFGGHGDRFYSVAEHAVLVSRRIFELTGDSLKALAGLHHDDSEAYLGDIPRPMKPLVQPAYGQMSDRMDAAICIGLSLPFGPHEMHKKYIKEVDNWALLLEANHLMKSRGINWAGSSMKQENCPNVPEDPSYWLGGLSPIEAEMLFLAEHRILGSLMWTIITFETGEWQALYNTKGEKVLENHTLNLQDVLEEVGVDVRFATASPEIDDESGYVPDYLSEYPTGGYS